ncbi:hypothetical protein MRB53_024963 [Persea americana]|uniref:Uncharacterized protein n=1 Tax=Persea americana TaxID=3435 RepID=A0ACC2LEF3_PERAE|nr:hypothetical protein MRB53_024963 [Persea americana]
MNFWHREKRAAAVAVAKSLFKTRNPTPPFLSSLFSLLFPLPRSAPARSALSRCTSHPTAGADTGSLSLFPPVFPSPSTPLIEDSFSLTAAAARSPSPHPQRVASQCLLLMVCSTAQQACAVR